MSSTGLSGEYGFRNLEFKGLGKAIIFLLRKLSERLHDGASV